jgi:hypothetical protein
MECWACGRTDVKKRPHGVPCTAGSRMGKEGMNGPARGGPCYCAACVARANERKE